MNYSLDKFVKPLLETDKIVTIFNNLGKPTYTINPLAVSRIYVSGNLLKINLTKNNTIIILDFSDNQEAKQALLRLQSQFNLIKNRILSEDKAKETAINQVQDSLDFSGLYQSILSGSTFSSPTASATASNTIESRLFSLVQKIGTDVVNINDKVTKKVTTSYSPSGFFSDEVDEYIDILALEFDFDSLGDVNIYVNSVLVLAEDTEDGIAYFGDGSTIKNTIFNGSRLYLNPYLLGYSLDPSDNISIESLKQMKLSEITTTTTTILPTTTTTTTEEPTTTTTTILPTTTTTTTEEPTTTTTTLDPKNGLLLYYDIGSTECYDGSSTLTDLSGSGHNGTISNAVFSSDNGGSLDFNGNGYVSTTYTVPFIDEKVDFTWNVWIKSKILSGMPIIGNRDNYSLPINFIKIHSYSFEYFPTSGSSGNISITLPINTWVNVCIVKSGTTIKYYLNGSVVGQSFNVGPIADTNSFYLGADPSANEYSNSQVAIVRVYDRAINATEVTQTYNSEASRFS